MQNLSYIPLPVLIGLTCMGLAVVWTAFENFGHTSPTDEAFTDDLST